MKRLLKILTFAGFTALGAAVLLIASALVVWSFPSLLLNETSLRWALKLGLDGASVHWDRLDLDVRSLSFSEKKITLHGEGICYATAGSANLSACAQGADLDMRVVLSRSTPSVHIEIFRLSRIEGDLSLPEAPKEATEKPVKKESWSLPSVPTWLERVTFRAMEISLEDLRVLRVVATEKGTSEKILKLSGKIAALAKGTGSEWTLGVQGYEVDRFGKRKMRAEANLVSTKSLWSGPYVGRADVDAQLTGGQRFILKAEAAPKSDSLVIFDVRGGILRRNANSRLAVHGELHKERVEAQLTGAVQNEGATIRPKNCNFSYAWGTGTERSGRVQLQCPLNVQIPPEHRFSRALGAELRALLSSDVRWPIEGVADRFGGNVSLRSDSLLREARDMRVDFSSTFVGSFSDLPNSVALETRASAEVGDFKSIVDALRGRRYAVPVPLAELDGSISLSCGMKGKPANSIVSIPCSLSTRLKSPFQKYFIDTEGTVETALTPFALRKVAWTVHLNDVEVVLPYLSLQAPPRFMPDSRIRVKEEDRKLAEEEPAPPIEYDIRVIADPNRPVRLHSNLAKNPVPLVADLRMTRTQPLGGMLRIASVNLDLFRRDAYLHHLRFRFLPRLDQSEIDGQVRVAYADYTIELNVLGQIGAPEIKLTSSPPLTDKEAWAVLLFGKKLEALDDVEANSVGSARTAVADGALSLASMYLLASTPVESIGYDPATKIFDARLKLADGTSLALGADDRSLRRVGIRKRLARDWYVTTFVKNPFEDIERQALSTLLEWSIGY